MSAMDATNPAVGRMATHHTDATRLRSLTVTGLTGALIAVVATTAVAGTAKALGVDFELPDGEQVVPLSGIALLTGFFSVVGVVIAAALRRWSAHPARRFVQVASTLVVLSLVPPFLAGANAATVAALLLLHLVAAAVMVPTLARALAGPAGGASNDGRA